MDVAPELAINPRESWADRDPPPAHAAEEVRFLLVHHTASTNNYEPDDVVTTIRDIHAFHTGPSKGWPDTCYHFFVDRFGGAWEARAGSLAGPVVADATGGNQGFAQLCCLIGDFTSEAPTDAAIATTTRLLAWLALRYGLGTAPTANVEFVSRGSNLWAEGTVVTTTTVAGHRDMSATACPGDTFYPYVHEVLPGDVDTLARSWQPPSPTTSSTPSTTAPTTTTPSTQPTTVPAPTPDTAAPPPPIATTRPPASLRPVEVTATSFPETALPVDRSEPDDGSRTGLIVLSGVGAVATVALIGGVVSVRRRSEHARESADGQNL